MKERFVQTFIPKVIRRDKGDYLNSEQYNNTNVALYNDMSTLFERELALTGRASVLATQYEAIAVAQGKVPPPPPARPTLDARSEYIFPLEGKQAIVDAELDEIVMPTSLSTSAILDTNGKLFPYLKAVRNSDNLVFSKKDVTVSELKVSNAFENGSNPYLFRVRGTNEKIFSRLQIDSLGGTFTFNTIEYYPFPGRGGTQLAAAQIDDLDQGVIPLQDPNGTNVPLKGKLRDHNFRIITDPKTVSQIAFDLAADLYLPGNNASVLGIGKIRILNNVYEPVCYIGFSIPASTSKLVSIKPVFKDVSSFKGNVTFKVYSAIESFRRKDATNISSFDINGKGTAVSLAAPVYVLATIESGINASPQILGFDIKTT
jgi:hypothetical protein